MNRFTILSALVALAAAAPLAQSGLDSFSDFPSASAPAFSFPASGSGFAGPTGITGGFPSGFAGPTGFPDLHKHHDHFDHGNRKPFSGLPSGSFSFPFGVAAPTNFPTGSFEHHEHERRQLSAPIATGSSFALPSEASAFSFPASGFVPSGGFPTGAFPTATDAFHHHHHHEHHEHESGAAAPTAAKWALPEPIPTDIDAKNGEEKTNAFHHAKGGFFPFNGTAIAGPTGTGAFSLPVPTATPGYSLEQVEAMIEAFFHHGRHHHGNGSFPRPTGSGGFSFPAPTATGF